MQRKHIMLWLGAALATSGCTTLKEQITSSGSMGEPDKQYVDMAAQLVQLDNAEGKLAASKAQDPRVIDIARQIMSQAASLSPGLQAAEQAEGITAPDKPSPDMTARVQKLAGLSGAAFDRQYVADELALHQKAVPVFQQEDTGTKDGALRLQVETELPAVQDNLNKLQVLSTEYKQAQG